MKIDINCDLGEGTSDVSLDRDKRLMANISSINLACGFHAGSYKVMQKTIASAISMGVKIGAHPGYQDPINFGRIAQDITAVELEALVYYQVGALKMMVESQDGTLHHIKLHGALYNQVAESDTLSKCLCTCLKKIDQDLLLYAPSGSILVSIAKQSKINVIEEFFADRRYMGYKLVSRSHDGVIESIDEIVNRTVLMLEKNILIDIHGMTLPINCQTICIHGDHPKSEEILKALIIALESCGVDIDVLKR